MAEAYIRHLMLPQVLYTQISGIAGVSTMIIHDERVHGERQFYASTEGSNFRALYVRQTPFIPIPSINRKRCMTTNILEVHTCLGLEAVCWLFSALRLHYHQMYNACEGLSMGDWHGLWVSTTLRVAYLWIIWPAGEFGGVSIAPPYYARVR